MEYNKHESESDHFVLGLIIGASIANVIAYIIIIL
jgi:hypothetical protein